MNNEQLKLKEKVEELERMLKDVIAWIEARKIQQIDYPLDDASRQIINRI